MARRYVKQLSDGDNIDDIYLVGDKQMRANRNGNLFLQIELRDRTGSISARLWNANESLFRLFDEGDLLRVKGRVQLFQGSIQLILSHITPVESEKADVADFLPHTEQDISKLLDRLRQVLNRLNNHHLRALVEAFLMDEGFVRAFCRVPAGVKNHHAYVGGLLEHVVTLLDIGEKVLACYPELDRDLVLMGLFLHDIGKVRELSYDRSFAYTDEGQLVGHLIIGVELLNEKISETEKLTGEAFPRELLLRLKHMILSHHGTYEFGSPRLPMTPEAIAVHYIDNLDAKVHTFTRDIRDDRNNASAWTPFSQSLQRRLYKGTADSHAPLYSPTLDGDPES
jgi:3'-5' exoribonuclease